MKMGPLFIHESLPQTQKPPKSRFHGAIRNVCAGRTCAASLQFAMKLGRVIVHVRVYVCVFLFFKAVLLCNL